MVRIDVLDDPIVPVRWSVVRRTRASRAITVVTASEPEP